MPEIVTLEQAKGHAKLKGDDWQDAELQEILDGAHERCLEYASQRINANEDGWQTTVSNWDEDTAPKTLKDAIRILFAHNQRFRGDDEDGVVPETERGRLPMQVEACLNRLKDPTLA